MSSNAENDAPVHGTALVPDYFVGTAAEWATLRIAQAAETRVIPPDEGNMIATCGRCGTLVAALDYPSHECVIPPGETDGGAA